MFVLSLTGIINGEDREIYFYRMKDGKPQVFTFNTPQAAQKCLQMFQAFGMNLLEQNMSNSMDMMLEIPKLMSFCSAFDLKELPEMTCEKVSFEEVMREKGIEI